MTRLGIVGALQSEIRAFGTGPVIPEDLARDRQLRPDRSVLRAVSGTGAERAYRAGKRLIEEGATVLVSWGTAAALDRTLTPGALVLPRNVVAHDGKQLRVDAEWIRCIRGSLPRGLSVCTRALAEARAPLLSVEDKRLLAQRTNAAAADMESGALAILAYEAGVPLVVVRAIVDSADLAVPARFAAATRADGSLCFASTVAWLACTPSQWRTAVRLASGFRAALLTLELVAREMRASA